MQLLCIGEFMQHLKSTPKIKVLAVWNAPNLRPSKKPSFLDKEITYTNKDFLGDWDIAILVEGSRADFYKLRQYWIQVKSRFSRKLYDSLTARWKGVNGIHSYLAVYGDSIRRREDIKLKHFRLFKTS